ncbi:hypothetical protein BY996DRAFT_7632602 [Phakopsora pachyrhizi]|nr:hypothetical protein BY996DRAFT_7632602 [Phakopsora pachyrhizi]
MRVYKIYYDIYTSCAFFFCFLFEKLGRKLCLFTLIIPFQITFYQYFACFLLPTFIFYFKSYLIKLQIFFFQNQTGFHL